MFNKTAWQDFSADKKHVYQSFLVPLVLYGIGTFVVVLMAGRSDTASLVVNIEISVFMMSVSMWLILLAVVYVLPKKQDKRQNFGRFVLNYNWTRPFFELLSLFVAVISYTNVLSENAQFALSMIYTVIYYGFVAYLIKIIFDKNILGIIMVFAVCAVIALVLFMPFLLYFLFLGHS